MNTKILSICLSTIILLTIIELVREEKLTFKYAAGWLIVSLVAIICSVFDQVVFDVATFFRFELASNFIFFTLLAAFVFLSILMTVFLCQQNSRNDKMAQKISLLENEIHHIKKDMGHS